jgi:hypothetical protein
VAGNWSGFGSFAWFRASELDDADNWMIAYTHNRDSGLLDQSNGQQIVERLEEFAEGDHPDVVFESHSHWAVGHVDGFSIRVRRSDGSITPAFEEFCRIQQELENYPVLNETDYSRREYEATLESYRVEMWRLLDGLPTGWEAEVYRWFSDHGLDQFTENRDDQGGWAPQDQIMVALESLGLLTEKQDRPTIVDGRAG